MAKNQYTDNLTEKQLKFCEAYLELSHGTNAAIKAGYTKNSAHVTASDLLKNPKIVNYLDYLRSERRTAIMNRLASYAEDAVRELYGLAMTAESENVRVAAIKDLLDRSGYKPVEKRENQNEINGKIQFSFVDPSLD